MCLKNGPVSGLFLNRVEPSLVLQQNAEYDVAKTFAGVLALHKLAL